MITALRLAAIIILASMLAVTSWASSVVALWNIPREMISHPWFIATLFDAYFGFLLFWFWVVYKERSVLKRVVWLIAILLFGNIAMAIYLLIQLYRVPASASIQDVLLRAPSGK